MSNNLRYQSLEINGDNRPTDYEYALISQHVYSISSKPAVGLYTTTTSGKWEVVTTKCSVWGYFGAIYVCSESKQVVVAHRGTNNFSDLLEDICGIIFNTPNTPQKDTCFSLCVEAVNLITSRYRGYQLSFTGHSLGAFLAELSVYYCYHFLRLSDVNAVTFESPGSKESILALEESAGDGRLPAGHAVLDIICYLCYPNLINVWNTHIGTTYSINVHLGSWGTFPGIHLLKCHSMDGIVEWFQEHIIQKNPLCKRHYMSDWPVGFLKKDVYFKYAEFDNGQYTIRRPLARGLSKPSREFEDIPFLEKILKLKKKKFELKVTGNFSIDNQLSEINLLPLQHFGGELQKFLVNFNALLCQYLSQTSKTAELEERWATLGLDKALTACLLSLSIFKNKREIEIVKLNSKSYCILMFRRSLSNWLGKHALHVNDFFLNKM